LKVKTTTANFSNFEIEARIALVDDYVLLADHSNVQ
jgi:hypothetical protein